MKQGNRGLLTLYELWQLCANPTLFLDVPFQMLRSTKTFFTNIACITLLNYKHLYQKRKKQINDITYPWVSDCGISIGGDPKHPSYEIPSDIDRIDELLL